VKAALALCIVVAAHGPALAAPLGLPALAAPPAAQVALGEALFFDRRLSVNGTLSCAMCHLPEQGFTANELRTSVGMEGVSLRRNAPTLLNVAFQRTLFHDGRAASLEEQALMPLLHPDEMANLSVAALVARVASLRGYGRLFAQAFGDAKPTGPRIARALAAYQRTLLAGDSPFDRWRSSAARVAAAATRSANATHCSPTTASTTPVSAGAASGSACRRCACSWCPACRRNCRPTRWPASANPTRPTWAASRSRVQRPTDARSAPPRCATWR
jgi:cytochrome c peroxidase